MTSKPYTTIFRYDTGISIRSTAEGGDVDPTLGLPELADIEISTICHGINGVGTCKFCYKNNSPNGSNMSIATFKKVFAKLPKTVCQIAFGIGSIDTCPDLWDIMQHCRDNFVVPNITVNGEGITQNIAERLGKLCGAVAVSLYDKEKTYNAVQLISKFCDQVNIHAVLSEETADSILEVLPEVNTDPRLKYLNAIVLLTLKKKGRATEGFTRISDAKYGEIIKYSIDNYINIGFDSCGTCRFVDWVKKNLSSDKAEELSAVIEPCESSLFSMYINVDGEFFPCSFIEGTTGWEHGIDMLGCEDFITEIWWSKKVDSFRTQVIACRDTVGCPVYSL